MEGASKWIGAIGILAILGFLCGPLFESARGEITVYKMFCTKDHVNGSCSGEEETANPAGFKVNADQQTVVTWIGDGPVTRHENCIVRDVNNWHCRNGPFEYYMTNGEYSERAEPPFIATTNLFYQVPRWRWWLVKLTQIVRQR